MLNVNVTVFMLLCLSSMVVLLWPSRMTFVRASNGQVYNVRSEPGAAKIADRLAALQDVAARFLSEASRKYQGEARAVVERIRQKWDGTLSEIPGNDEVAYSLDKNSVAICVRAPGGGIETLNRSVFVLLHEFAHIATADTGHTPEFWRNMKILLEMAHALGVYKDDLHQPESTYCGHPLGQSPMTCVRQRTCTSAIS